ncbi:uncharacterized protein K452DRAFT_84608 [Aplosporella prunicola CBS 121167]|uniref:Uncharacterized protein n=1 Tax=Aplosporella prunicola CBS 121167 TaxID=1176127 RepID=A0A6A6B3Z7_9PEZI|nr:uncharacterized protein K452DRAFT_84608 [Aplosporella prunicola CBS 121167]KAF2138790.1 hypothetical protein K452DRAFT_84608 [Aplosporella prunicola CBS 121167]
MFAASRIDGRVGQERRRSLGRSNMAHAILSCCRTVLAAAMPQPAASRAKATAVFPVVGIACKNLAADRICARSLTLTTDALARLCLDDKDDSSKRLSPPCDAGSSPGRFPIRVCRQPAIVRAGAAANRAC